jgi:hypothetical protein
MTWKERGRLTRDFMRTHRQMFAALQRGTDSQEAMIVDIGADHDRFYALVPQQFLDGVNIMTTP